MDRRIERNQICLTGNSVEVIPAFNALSLSLHQLFTAQSSHHQTPPTHTWLGRRIRNWLWQAVQPRHFIWCEQLLSLLNSVHHETDVLSTSHAEKCWSWTQIQAFSWHKVCVFTLYISMTSRSQARSCMSFSNYMHIPILIYFCFVFCICSLMTLKHDNFIIQN